VTRGGRGRAFTSVTLLLLALGLFPPRGNALDQQLLAELLSGPRGFALTMSLAQTSEWDAVISLAELQSETAVPAKARKLFRKALKADRKKRTLAAIRMLEQAVAVAPGYFQAYGALAVGYLKLGSLDRAKHYAELALLINPDSLPGREIRALVLLVEGRRDEAAARLRELARRSPTRRSVHYHLAKALRRTGEVRLAEEHLLRAAALLRRQSVPKFPPRISEWKPSDLRLPWRW